MVVSGPPSRPLAGSADVPEDETKPELRFQRRSPATISTDSIGASFASSSLSSSLSAGSSSGASSARSSGSGEGAAMAFAGEGAPAALSASGVFRPLPGVHRQVTGLFFPDLDAMNAKSSSSRIWYAAIDARPRGPFSASEMVALAEKGKIRESTLVWRPGFPTWHPLRSAQTRSSEGGREVGDDLAWLLKIVRARKQREREAQTRAEQKHGIKPVALTRTSSGRRPSASSIPGMPPLPDDRDDVRADDENPALTSGSFLWRADDMPHRSDEVRAPTIVRRRQSSTLALLGIVALVIAVAAGGMVATKMHALERAALLIKP